MKTDTTSDEEDKGSYAHEVAKYHGLGKATKTPWREGYEDGLEAAARLIENGQEEVDGDNSRQVRIRKEGNLMGLAFAEKIRSMIGLAP